jgi:hypothetical protein
MEVPYERCVRAIAKSVAKWKWRHFSECKFSERQAQRAAIRAAGRPRLSRRDETMAGDGYRPRHLLQPPQTGNRILGCACGAPDRPSSSSDAGRFEHEA